MNASEVNTGVITNPVVLGKIGGHFGVKGWLKVVSYTRPVSQIFQHNPWLLGGVEGVDSWSNAEITAFKENAKRLIVKFSGSDRREDTEKFIGCDIGIDRFQLEKLGVGQYYWLELAGLQVVNLEGVVLGKVDHLLETGANDVLVVHSVAKSGRLSERLLPWTPSVVVRVDLENQVMTVDWKEDYLV